MVVTHLTKDKTMSYKKNGFTHISTNMACQK